ncbi:MAG: amino acid adenylation domain-containing protein [Hyphomicrobiales bacterium]|nr:amino acid adenylation domain-containing protein [Hyphomicrobiales bacterium]
MGLRKEGVVTEVYQEQRRPAGKWGKSHVNSVKMLADSPTRLEPFPLTEVQRAYWLGRGDYFELGNIGCHLYIELTRPGLEHDRLEAAWRRLIARHDMLRAIIRDDGRQQVLAQVPPYQVRHHRLIAATAEQELRTIREEMSHRVYSVHDWPMFELRTSEQGGQAAIHLSIDLLFVDVWSIQILLDEMLQLSFDPSTVLPPLAINFRDCVLAAAERGASAAAYARAEAYWMKRLDTLPPAPRLPLVKEPSTITRPHFVRRDALIELEVWERLKARSAKANITASGALLTAFVRVLAQWGESSHFTLNTTLLQRDLQHPDVARVVGDFTGLCLLEVRTEPDDTFEAVARRIASQFRSDLRHRHFSGLKVLQELAKRGDADRSSLMPVVFTSAVSPKMPGWGLADTFKRVFGVSQTPQVYLDYQVVERNGCLEITWDAIDELFPSGLLDDMQEAYCRYLCRLADDETAWSETGVDLRPAAQRARHAEVNATAAPVEEALLHAPFLAQAQRHPDHPAIITPERRLSYGDLLRQASRLAAELQATGAIRPNRLVAVVMEKGWEQIVAAVAVMQAGGAYLPIEPDLPRERIHLLLARGGVEVALTQPSVASRIDWPAGVQLIPVDWQETSGDVTVAASPAQPHDLAYVIFTSGSTGEPKGVMIEHRSALNTVRDINDRFAVGPADRVLALSSLSFDLSVYDVFGALAAGATIVVPHPTSAREPADWAELIRAEKVTIWNSVPALLELLVDHLEPSKDRVGDTLRLALLSGDWIPVGLPPRARAVLPRLAVVSLGGATEASIWSIIYPIGEIAPDWRSIPYGHALRNQRMLVLDEAMVPSPTWVPGNIHIGGVGLARGYWRDPARTDAQFVVHPETGERLYRTGDLGRMLPDGNIEFLGRADHQVKVQGFRIELGEIEATLERHPAVKAAVVKAVGARSGPKRLVGYVVAEGVSDEDLAAHLRQKLPSYMIPTVWQRLDAMPLSANGKVDRKALPEPAVAIPAAVADASQESGRDTGQDTGILARMTALLAQELSLPSLDPGKSLLTLGATSIDLVRIVGRLQKELSFRPSFQQFLRNPSAAALAELYRQSNAVPRTQSAPVATAKPAAELILDPAAKEAFRRERHGIRLFPGDWGRVRLDDKVRLNGMRERIVERRTVRQFRAEPVPVTMLAALLAELSCLRTPDGNDKYGYGSAGGLYPVQTYLHAKPDGVAGLPAGTFYYDPSEHALVPIVLGAELSPEIHEPFTNRPTFECARFSLFLVSQPRAIEPIYGDLASRFSFLEAGAMAHALETSAASHGIGLCAIGWLDFAPVRSLLQLEDGQELLHTHVGGLADADMGDWEEGVV